VDDTIVMLDEGGCHVSLNKKTRQLNYLLAFMMSVIALVVLVSCGNNGPSSPNPDPNSENGIQLQPAPDEMTANPRIDIRENKPSDLSILPQDEVTTESIQDLAGTMFLLREKGGGVTTLDGLGANEFAIHIWDKISEINLPARVAVACSNGVASVLDVNGWAIVEGAAFPMNVTVRVPGYALESYVYTSGNILSFAMSPMVPEGTSVVFGIADNHGYGDVEIYTDELSPRHMIEHPSVANPQFCQFNIPFTSNKMHGFSAFLSGNVDIDELGTPGSSPGPGLVPFIMKSEINWEIAPLIAGMQRFYQVGFARNENPKGIARGSASVPYNYWLDGISLLNNVTTATPTVVFIDDERYIPIGPSRPMTGDNPLNLTYNCFYFNPSADADRVVMAGRMLQENGGMDIVHQDWHPGTNPDAISFSGCPVFEVADGMGTTLPVFAWVDPLGDDGDFFRVDCRISGIPIWNLTGPSIGSGFDSTLLCIPPVWVSEVTSGGMPEYQMESLKTLGLSIDSFNRHDIIKYRTEACFSPWCEKIE
jgi:hypothetical protein